MYNVSEISKQIWIAFFPVFGIVLTIVLFIIQARLDLLSLSAKYVAINTILALLISLGTAFLVLTGSILIAKLSYKAWRLLLVGTTLHTLKQAARHHSPTVQAIGIGSREGSVIIRLAISSQSAVLLGVKFEVLNTARREKLGTLEVVEIEDTSCLCYVFDRINVEFWDSLEERMGRDPSPPLGITISREFPDGLLEFMQGLVRNWRG